MRDNFHCVSAFYALTLLVFIFPLHVQSRNIVKLHAYHHSDNHRSSEYHRRNSIGKPNCYHGASTNKALMHKRADTMRIAGSSLPNCTHACGSCTPCRLVMVGFVCSSLEEAETCPMAYKCMCHNKSYPIP